MDFTPNNIYLLFYFPTFQMKNNSFCLYYKTFTKQWVTLYTNKRNNKVGTNQNKKRRKIDNIVQVVTIQFFQIPYHNICTFSISITLAQHICHMNFCTPIQDRRCTKRVWLGTVILILLVLEMFMIFWLKYYVLVSRVNIKGR